MKRHALFAALLCFSAPFFAASKLDALTIPASEDSYTGTGNRLSLATNNANSLIVDTTRKSYLYFDLSDIPTDTVVRWAKLRLFLPIVQRPGAGLSVHVVTSEWNESRTSNLPTISTGSIGVITPDKMASRRFVTVDVTSTVQKWIKGGTLNGGTLNEGFAIQPIVKAGSSTASVILTSKEGPVFGLPAELDIEFQPEGGVDKPVTFDQLPPIGYAQLSSAFKTWLSPIITVQPVIPPSLWGSLSVQAQGLGNLSYQWMRNGLAIIGGTNSQLPLIGGVQGGTYTVVVSNGLASVTSEGVQFSGSKITDSFALVTGGTLPASLLLGAASVDTFYLGKTEVTWGEWRTVRTWALANGYTDLDGVGQGAGDNFPVSHVNLYDVFKWCNARSEKEGKTPVYAANGGVYKIGQVIPSEVALANGYRLPTYAEWEFAARGGTQAQGCTYSGNNDLNAVGWYSQNSGDAVHEVGKKLPNELGIFDMSGNLSEWSRSRFPGTFMRVTKGGSYRTPAEACAIAIDDVCNQEGRDGLLGFRVATSGEYAAVSISIAVQPSLSLDGRSISVQAEGVGALTYNWMCNGVPVDGGTSSQLPTEGLQSGTYTVRVSNGQVSKTSAGIQYPSIVGTFAVVTGGILPAPFGLGPAPIDTFYIGRAEITRSEWLTVLDWAIDHAYTDLEPLRFGDNYRDDYSNYPASVSWFDAVKWCNARSEKEGKTPVYKVNGGVYRTGQASSPEVNFFANGYRLPSEKEWEFAARGGLQTQGYTYSGSNNLDDVAWYSENYSLADFSFVHEVGKKLPNELGIYDMSGNLWEWTGNQIIRGAGRTTIAETIDINGHSLHFRYYVGFRVATSGEYAAVSIAVQPSLSLDGRSISVQAEGVGALTYNWMCNGVPVNGGTSSQLPTEGLQSGTYTVRVSNGQVSKTSAGIQYPYIGSFALVTRGALPASSPLGTAFVETFYIGRTEVTWGEWKKVRTWAVENGYTDLVNVGQGLGDNYPVTRVNSYDVMKWCNARSEKEGKTPVYMNGTVVYRTGEVPEPVVVFLANGYRLPSEAEWEFAARGGTQTNGYNYSGSNNLDEVGWYQGNSGGAVKEVGKKQANELGIYDMSGNLREWSGSWYPDEGSYWVLRGGSWDYDAGYCTVADRSGSSSEGRYDDLGFRVATYGEYVLGITAQPSLSSDGVNIIVQAEGAGTLTYQWIRNGVAIAGGTSAVLPTQGLQNGRYTVLVSNGFVSKTSEGVEYPSPVGTLALVSGGTLPASSPLFGLHVDTFYIGKTEVTWGEWLNVRMWAVANGYTDLDGVGQGVGDNFPVTNVGWFDVVKWCNAQSEKEGKTPVYKDGTVVYRTGDLLDPQVISSANGYRLPTDAEWEFAARGGTQTQGYTYSGSNDLNAVGWNYQNSGNAAHEVGRRLPNELGIFDMSGNLSEWNGSLYPLQAGLCRVIRGTDWNSWARWSESEYSPGFPGSPGSRGNRLGFRVATSGEYAAVSIAVQPSLSSDGRSISVQAEGVGALTYNWMCNGAAVNGGTSSQLPTEGLQSGTYTVSISNGQVSKTSAGIQYPSPVGTFAVVTGGTLPASSPLGTVFVETFYIGRTEITWGEWKAVWNWAVEHSYTDLVGVGKSVGDVLFANSFGFGDNDPVNGVNWFDVVKWCNARSEKEGKTPVYMADGAVYKTGQVAPTEVASANGYRLPSEKEWEFAARGGTQTQGYTYSGGNDLNAVGWYNQNFGYAMHEVGKKQANELGIYDMSGNLREWSGSWSPGYEGSFSVIRGGGWTTRAEDCAVATRSESSSEGRYYGNGFRVALSATP